MAYRTTENQLFYNVPTSSYPRGSVAGYPADPTTNPNDSLAKTNGSSQKTGPSIILKVMSGDVVDIAAKSFWTANGNPPTSPSIMDVLNSLASGVVGLTNGSKGTIGELNTVGSPLYIALNTFITNNDPAVANKPKAYLNWILLDEQFKYVNTYPQSGAVPVSNFTAGTLGTPGYTGIPITKSGYLYIYVSNESQGWDVFFDNLTVQHRPGPISEETHYYPFGLTMAAISSKAIGKTENRYKYNGKELEHQEFSDGTGLESYDYAARMFDPQLGVWHSIDPLSEKSRRYSPYVYGLDNPIRFIDPDGMSADSSQAQKDTNGPYGTSLKDLENSGGAVCIYLDPSSTESDEPDQDGDQDKNKKSPQQKAFESHQAKMLSNAATAQIQQNLKVIDKDLSKIKKLKEKLYNIEVVAQLNKSLVDDATAGDPASASAMMRLGIRARAIRDKEDTNAEIGNTQKEIDDSFKQNANLQKFINVLQNYIIPETIIFDNRPN